ncbi:hypothetical protein BAE44_0026346 [Dichanthelium oligosanthes]|uniref:RING-type domain-containing protein n=1 Tax=Dichanthelium oligosanthes TaxID=888268 RepID=A0A1E5UID9_9POAL|nr:hypothetical protein BAE44_0026346 [Dichanthelium oligosanthes]
MAAALAAGAAWCLSIVAAGWSASRGDTTEDSARGLCGLAQVDIRALPASPYQHRVVGPAAGGVTCSVCLEEVRGGEMVRSLPECRHLFHVGCIDPWLHSHVTCPLCRVRVLPGILGKYAVLHRIRPLGMFGPAQPMARVAQPVVGSPMHSGNHPPCLPAKTGFAPVPNIDWKEPADPTEYRRSRISCTGSPTSEPAA